MCMRSMLHTIAAHVNCPGQLGVRNLLVTVMVVFHSGSRVQAIIQDPNALLAQSVYFQIVGQFKTSTLASSKQLQPF